MKIKIDGKEIIVTDPTKNIVEIAADNGIGITAPCYREKKRKACCKACLIEVLGEKKYACGTKPIDGMDITYNRNDLKAIRLERLKEYSSNKSTNKKQCCDTPSIVHFSDF